jgi:hypothetical protein
MKYKIMYLVGTLIIASAIALVGTLTFWAVYPYKPLKINEEPLHVIKKEVKDEVYYVLDYCKNTDKPVSITNRFIDGVVFVVPDVRAFNKRGCEKITIVLDVPKVLPPGEYYIEVVYTYQMNPIREVTVETRTENFRIL